MIPKITQQGLDSTDQYWCENCGASLPNPYRIGSDEHTPVWKFCPFCGEPIDEYDKAQPVQWAELNCERCGGSLIMEIQGKPHPQYIATSDYVGGRICRSCLEEHCAQTNCLQCEVGQQPNCPYAWIKKTVLEHNNDTE